MIRTSQKDSSKKRECHIDTIQSVPGKLCGGPARMTGPAIGHQWRPAITEASDGKVLINCSCAELEGGEKKKDSANHARMVIFANCIIEPNVRRCILIYHSLDQTSKFRSCRA